MVAQSQKAQKERDISKQRQAMGYIPNGYAKIEASAVSRRHWSMRVIQHPFDSPVWYMTPSEIIKSAQGD